MKTARVQLYGITGKYVVVSTEATAGATVGSDLKWPDGSTVTEAQLRAATTPPTESASYISTSDDVDEGQYNTFFTAQRAQDAVGSILTDTATIDFSYDGTAHVIKADLQNLSNAGGGSLVKINRDAKGRVAGTSSASTDDLSEGIANFYATAARVNGYLDAGDGIGLVFAAGKTTISIVGLPIYLIDEAGNQLTDESGNLLTDTATTGLPTPFANVTDTPTTLAGYGITDAQRVGDPVKMPAYTLLTLPSAATYIDCLVVCTNLTEGRRLVYSDGTNWLRLTNNTVAN